MSGNNLCGWLLATDFLIPCALVFEVIVIFEVYINIINVIAVAMLDTDARYEYYELKYEYKFIEIKKGKNICLFKQKTKKLSTSW